jgi:hypothetical protein
MAPKSPYTLGTDWKGSPSASNSLYSSSSPKTKSTKGSVSLPSSPLETLMAQHSLDSTGGEGASYPLHKSRGLLFTLSRTAAFSRALDANVADILKKEAEAAAKKTAGRLSDHDLPPFNPDAPRGGSSSGHQSALEAHLAQQRAAAGGGGVGGIGGEGLNEKSDPKLLVGKILEVRTSDLREMG